MSASSATAVELEATTADAGGNYSIAGLGAADDYTVRFSACGTANLVSEYYDDKPDIDSADLVTVVDGVPTAGISAELATGGSITGTVTGPGGAPLDDVCVQANGPTDTGSAETDAGGDYTIDSLPTGDYEVHFESCIAGALLSEYYDDKPTAATADLVAVTAGTPTPDIDAELALGGTISGTVTGPAARRSRTSASAPPTPASTTPGQRSPTPRRVHDRRPARRQLQGQVLLLRRRQLGDRVLRRQADPGVGRCDHGHARVRRPPASTPELVGGATISGTVTGPAAARS